MYSHGSEKMLNHIDFKYPKHALSCLWIMRSPLRLYSQNSSHNYCCQKGETKLVTVNKLTFFKCKWKNKFVLNPLFPVLNMDYWNSIELIWKLEHNALSMLHLTFLLYK